MSINKAIIVGFVGKDPEVKYLDSGTAVANFSVATSESYTNRSGEKVTQTEWHNIVLWRGLAEVAEKYVKKGTQVYVEGRIRTRSWDDRDGNKRYTTEIVGDIMQLMGKRGDNPGGESSTQYSAANKSVAQDPVPDKTIAQDSVPDKAAASESTEKSAPNNEGADDLPF